MSVFLSLLHCFLIARVSQRSRKSEKLYVDANLSKGTSDRNIQAEEQSETLEVEAMLSDSSHSTHHILVNTTHDAIHQSSTAKTSDGLDKEAPATRQPQRNSLTTRSFSLALAAAIHQADHAGSPRPLPNSEAVHTPPHHSPHHSSYVSERSSEDAAPEAPVGARCERAARRIARRISRSPISSDQRLNRTDIRSLVPKELMNLFPLDTRVPIPFDVDILVPAYDRALVPAYASPALALVPLVPVEPQDALPLDNPALARRSSPLAQLPRIVSMDGSVFLLCPYEAQA